MGLDLHTHSVYSDGSLTPEEIVDVTINLGLAAVSITDHDNILAYEYARSHAEMRSKETGNTQLEIIPGIEINTMHEKQEVHILGYYINSANKQMQDLIAYQQHVRIQQTIEIVKKLKDEAKINIKLEDVTSLVKEGGSVGRPHIAKAIVNAGGVSNMIEAYRRYICDNSPTYVKRKTVSPFEAVETIYESGGIPVVAHPCDLNGAEDLIKELMNYGLRGVEVYHRKHSPAIIEYYSSIAEKYKLIMTGGSDCHGPRPNGQLVLGKVHVPAWVLTELKKEKSRLEIAAN
ncbi:MAG: PHP domain-containing protein [bacterium]